jgi:hypothetical protein
MHIHSPSPTTVNKVIGDGFIHEISDVQSFEDLRDQGILVITIPGIFCPKFLIQEIRQLA